MAESGGSSLRKAQPERRGEWARARLYRKSRHGVRFLGLRTEGRNNDLYYCARIGVKQPQLAAKFFCSLIHSSDADANAARMQLRDWIFDSLAVILYFDHHALFSLRQGDPRFLRSRMPIDIG